MAGRLNRNQNFHKPITWVEPCGKAVTSRTFGELLVGVQLIRRAEGGDLSPGWHNRFQDEVCAKDEYNSMCIEVDDRESSQEAVKYIGRADVQRFFQTVQKFISSGGELVDKEEATRRARICAMCPHNVPIRGCMGCSCLIPKLLKLTKGASTELDGQLKGCGVCGCQLKAKVHLPRELSTDDNLPFPEHCWIATADSEVIDL